MFTNLYKRNKSLTTHHINVEKAKEPVSCPLMTIGSKAWVISSSSAPGTCTQVNEPTSKINKIKCNI